MSEHMSPAVVREVAGNKVVVSRTISFVAHRRLFLRGHLALECRVTLSQLVWKATNDLILEDYSLGNGAPGVCWGSVWWRKGIAMVFLSLYHWMGWWETLNKGVCKRPVGLIQGRPCKPYSNSPPYPWVHSTFPEGVHRFSSHNMAAKYAPFIYQPICKSVVKYPLINYEFI